MAEYIGLRFPLNEDLKAFSQLLWQQRIPHRIAEDQGAQLLWVATEEHAALVRELHQKMLHGELDISIVPSPRSAPRSSLFARLLARRQPLVTVLLLLSLVGAALPWLDVDLQLLPQLTFYPLSLVTGQVEAIWPLAQPWRVFTPIFLHFGLLHIAFNGLWLWELGGMIEQRQGSVRLLGVVALVAACSNIAQAAMSTVLFGGMSGAIYGLLGYIVAWNRLRASQQFPLPPAVAWFMIGWLVVCLSGFTSLLGVGEIANTAHISGLLMGLLLGVVAAVLDSPAR